MRKNLLLILIFVWISNHIYAQQIRLSPEKGYLKSYMTDTKDLLIQPAGWNKKEWIILGSSAATFVLIYTADNDIQQFFSRNQNSQTSWVSHNMIQPLGNGLFVLPALGLFYGSGWVFHNQKSREVALLSTKAWVLTGGATFALKQLAHRQGPSESGAPNASTWHGPYAFTNEYTSFPSNHTSTAFALAAVFSGSYADKKWVGIMSYSLASLVGVSRVYDNQHWASDVFVGGLLGWWIGRSLVKINAPVRMGAQIGNGYFTGSLDWRF